MITEVPAKVDPKVWGNIFRAGADYARGIIEANYEEHPDPLHNLPYHNWLHSRRVRRRGDTIIDAVRFVDPALVTLEDKVLVDISATFHDTRQDWKEEDGRRVMLTGHNEAESAKIAIAFMNQWPVFNDVHKARVEDAILTTRPGWKDGTVIQPYLTPSCSLVTWSVAMGDTRSCLIDGPLSFVPEGDALFREINMDIMADLLEKGPKGLSNQVQRSYSERMFDWLNGQIKFVEGAQRRLEEDLTCIPEHVRAEVGKIFDQGENSKEMLRKEIVERRDLSFGHLVQAFGYILRPSVEAAL